jgi:signal transduction histidine kinase
MTMSFAARAATKKLGTIVALLLIPALFFGGAFVRQMMQDTAFLKREIYGVELAELAFSAMDNNVTFEDKVKQTRVSKLEKILGLAADENLAAHLEAKKSRNSATTAHEHQQGQVFGYIADIASESGLILDSESETYHLAHMLLISLPVVWSEAADFEKVFLETTPQLSTRAKLALTAGHLDGAYARQSESLRRAIATSDHPQKYSLLVAADERLGENIGALGKAITSSETVLNDTQVLGLARGIQRLSGAAVAPAFAMLKAKLETRKAKLEQTLYVLIAIGLLTTAIATYLASRMISTTFNKLDAVEEAHRVSELMRQEADRVNKEVADLNRNLADSLQQLQRAQDELLSKGKMEQLGQLTATVAHEIRNPLGSVRTSAFLIGRKLDVKALGIAPQLDRINKGVDRCDSIITQLLDFSRTKHVVTLPSSLDDWLETVLREESERLPNAVSLDCVLGLSGLEVSFDQARMRRALSNLLHNASEAMLGNDTKPVENFARQPLIKVETKQSDGFVDIVVKDNGPGMSADVLSKIKEPLFTTKNFGTGLGVPAVEQIVQQHGGELLISSEPDKGATFTIRIPCHPVRSDAA